MERERRVRILQRTKIMTFEIVSNVQLVFRDDN